jgi:hypothetical protein
MLLLALEETPPDRLSKEKELCQEMKRLNEQRDFRNRLKYWYRLNRKVREMLWKISKNLSENI